MQPYQEASEEIKKQKELPGIALKKAATTGASLAAGGAALQRILPLLNQFIPAGIASKGLSKIDPRFGKFINGAVENGTTMDDALGFIKDKVSGGEEKQKRNVIEMHSPDLFKFIQQEIQKGKTPAEAARLSQNIGNFRNDMQKIMKDLQIPTWVKAVESVFGGGDMAVNQQVLGNQPQQQDQQQQAQGQGQQQGPANGDQALMAALQKILQM